MTVYEFEPFGRAATLYTYSVTADTLQISNNILYSMNNDENLILPTLDTDRVLSDFDLLDSDLTTDTAIIKANEYLGTLGLDTAIPSTQKENLWVL